MNDTTATWGTQPGYLTMLMGTSSRVNLTFRITDFGNTYYGWLDLQTQQDASKNLTLTIHGWAYSTGSILVGTAPVAIPGGTGLAALACGAAGLRGRRRSRVATLRCVIASSRDDLCSSRRPGRLATRASDLPGPGTRTMHFQAARAGLMLTARFSLVRMRPGPAPTASELRARWREPRDSRDPSRG